MNGLGALKGYQDAWILIYDHIRIMKFQINIWIAYEISVTMNKL